MLQYILSFFSGQDVIKILCLPFIFCFGMGIFVLNVVPVVALERIKKNRVARRAFLKVLSFSFWGGGGGVKII